ncbi:signal peptidase II [Anaerolineales bacterium HSG6]|nr:signal peptidase II [Anaerolineales bacterium HSG6]
MTVENNNQSPTPAKKQPSAFNKWWRAMPTILGIAAVVLGLDTLTKLLVVTNLNLGDTWTVIPGLEPIFKFTFITNTGAAFGMFSQFGGLFTIIGVLVIGAIITLHHHLPTEIFWIRLSLGLLLGGAMGNFIDRISRGYVVDFIDIGFWPIFNIADLAIVCGVAILSYHLWDEEEETQAKATVNEVTPLNPA